MMKKIKLAPLATALLMLFALAACSGEAMETIKGGESTAAVTDAGADIFASMLASGDDLVITKAGEYTLTGEQSGRVYIDAGKEDDITLILDGATITSGDGPAIYALQSGSLTITLKDGTTSSVSDGSVCSLMQEDDQPYAAIFSKDDLTLNGAGTLVVTGNYNNGIGSKDDLVVESGTYEITAVNDAVRGRDSVTVLGGSFTITSGGDGVKSNNDEDTSQGNVTISGGTFSIDAGDDGVHADGALTVDGGSITILNCYEGLEGASVTVNGGTVDITASDDGINAAGGNDSMGSGPMGNDTFNASSEIFIRIAGGTVTIDAAGDGIDSNGLLYLDGGEVYVSGPTDNANGALDANGCVVTGGVIIAAGSSGMAMAPDGSSTQCSAMFYLTETCQGGTQITLQDADGNALASFTPEKAYSSVVVSTPELQEGGGYTLYIDGAAAATITLSGVTTTSGTGGGMGGQMGGGFGNRGGNQQPPGGGRPAFEGGVPGAGTGTAANT